MATGLYKCATLRCAPDQMIDHILENYTDAGVVNVDLMEGPGTLSHIVNGNVLSVSGNVPGCYVVRVECCRPVISEP